MEMGKKAEESYIKNGEKVLKNAYFLVLSFKNFFLPAHPKLIRRGKQIISKEWGGGGCNDRNAQYIPLISCLCISFAHMDSLSLTKHNSVEMRRHKLIMCSTPFINLNLTD